MQFKSPFRRLALYGAVYFVEGAVLTYFSTFNILYVEPADAAAGLWRLPSAERPRVAAGGAGARRSRCIVHCLLLWYNSARFPEEMPDDGI